MTKLYRIRGIRIRKDQLILVVDKKEYRFNLADVSPKLSKADKKEQKTFEISPSGYGIRWPLLDEDISIHALINSSKAEAVVPRP